MTNNLTTPALIVLKEPAKEKVFALKTNLITIGRGEVADMCLAGDTAISRIHVELRLVDGRYHLINRSENGTQVNDKLAEDQALRNGDRIRLGDVYLLEFSDGSKPVEVPRTSMFVKPWVLVGCGLY